MPKVQYDTDAGASFLKLCLVSIVVVLFTSSANAQTYFGGIGEYTCQRFLVDVVHTDTQTAALSWAQGYIAGINVAAITDHGYYYDVAGITGIEVLKHIATFCRANMDQPLIAASDAVLATLPKVQAPEGWR